MEMFQQLNKAMKNWILLMLNLLVLVYTIPYFIGLFNGKFTEGYEIALSGVVFNIISFPILIYYLIKNKKWKAKTLGLMMGVYTVVSFLGLKFSVIFALIFSLVMLIVIFNKKNP
jgi:hypothetical protein